MAGYTKTKYCCSLLSTVFHIYRFHCFVSFLCMCNVFLRFCLYIWCEEMYYVIISEFIHKWIQRFAFFSNCLPKLLFRYHQKSTRKKSITSIPVILCFNTPCIHGGVSLDVSHGISVHHFTTSILKFCSCFYKINI